MRAKEFITEGYTLRAVNRSKFLEPGSEVDYVPDINVKSTDYEIVNNKTGQVVGNAAWASDDYMGPGDLFIYMNNGAQRSIKVKNDPQAAFNHFVKQQKTSRKYKEAVGETASAGASSAGAVASVSAPMGGTIHREKKHKGLFGEDADDDLLQTGSNLGGSKNTNFAVVDTKVGGWIRTYPDQESAEKWAAAWNRKYGHKEMVKVVQIRESIEAVNEALKPGDWVVITRGPRKGTEGTIGEIHHGSYKGAPKSYIIDINGDYQKGSIRVLRSMFTAKKKVHEAMGDEMIEVVFNNENAMELAYSKFDFDWQGDMMFIEEKYLGQLEDLLFSHGFDEPEDFEIDPEDPMLKDYDAYESKEEKQYKKLPYDEFVKGAKLKEPRTPRGKGKRQPKMGVK
jgi:hypothetical protein